MPHSSHVLAASNYIQKRGIDIDIMVAYTLSSEVHSGDQTLPLTDIFGLLPGIFSLGSESVTVVSVNFVTKEAIIAEPLVTDHVVDSQLIASITEKAIPINKGRNLSRDDTEFVQRVRVGLDCLLSYGGQIRYNNRQFFIVGADLSDLSYSVRMIEIQTSLSLWRTTNAPATTLGGWTGQVPVIGVPTSNQCEIASSIPARVIKVSNTFDERDDGPGERPGMYGTCLVPRPLDVQVGDKLIDVYGPEFRVTGIDLYSIRNMLTLSIDLDTYRPGGDTVVD